MGAELTNCEQRKKDCWNRDVRYECPKNLKDMVQEVIDIEDWAKGNAISIFIFNSATDQDINTYSSGRSIVGFDTEKGAEFSPVLKITYDIP